MTAGQLLSTEPGSLVLASCVAVGCLLLSRMLGSLALAPFVQQWWLLNSPQLGWACFVQPRSGRPTRHAPLLSAEIAAVVGRLCADTGVEVPPAAAAGNTGVDSRFLLSLVRQVQAAVGVA